MKKIVQYFLLGVMIALGACLIIEYAPMFLPFLKGIETINDSYSIVLIAIPATAAIGIYRGSFVGKVFIGGTAVVGSLVGWYLFNLFF